MTNRIVVRNRMIADHRRCVAPGFANAAFEQRPIARAPVRAEHAVRYSDQPAPSHLQIRDEVLPVISKTYRIA